MKGFVLTQSQAGLSRLAYMPRLERLTASIASRRGFPWAGPGLPKRLPRLSHG